MPFETADKIWMNGELVDWDDAKIHVLTHSLHYGLGVFEGIRAYETDQGPAVFRLEEHIERLFDSAKIYMIDMPFTRRGARSTPRSRPCGSTSCPVCYIRPHRLPRLRRDGPQPAAVPGRRGHRHLAVGLVPR